MKKTMFDTLVIGQPSLDINTDHEGNTIQEIGGAVVYSGYAAAALGHSVAVLPKANPKDMDTAALFSKASNITVFPLASPQSTSIENIYHTADKERRTCRAIGRITPYQISELPPVQAKIIHLAGLMYGDISNELIAYAAQNADCAVDVQCLLRHADGENGEMNFRDWAEKCTFLPKIRFLKTDAVEAEILTGLSDRKEAAKQLFAWGSKEIMITHNTEVLLYDGNEFYTQPLKPRNLSGRSGRGDTTFASYITERLHHSIPEALLTSAALVSMKMESPGPFLGNRSNVQEYINQFFT